MGVFVMYPRQEMVIAKPMLRDILSHGSRPLQIRITGNE